MINNIKTRHSRISASNGVFLNSSTGFSGVEAGTGGAEVRTNFLFETKCISVEETVMMDLLLEFPGMS